MAADRVNPRGSRWAAVLFGRVPDSAPAGREKEPLAPEHIALGDRAGAWYSFPMSNLRKGIWVVATSAVVLASSCGGNERALARVGHHRLEIASFQSYVSDVTGDTWSAVNARVTSRLLDQYLDRQVVLEAARERDVDVGGDPEELGPPEVQWLLDELCGPPPEPSAEEIASEVERRAGNVRPARAHVRQLLLDSLEQGLEARRRLLQGEDFVAVSRSMSRAPNADGGGELGFFDQGSLPPEIDEVIFSLAPGAFSDPVQGPSGYHVFQVLEIVPAGPPDPAEVETEVRAEFTQRTEREHVHNCVRKLATEIGVEIYNDQLWFEYTGQYVKGQADA